MTDLFSGPHVILLGLALLVMAFVIRRTGRRIQRRGSRDVLDEVRREMLDAEQSQRSFANRIEVRLHDFEREVQGRVGTTLTMLDELIQEADREIVHMEMLLASRKEAAVDEEDVSVPTPLDAEQTRMIRHLADAGYRPQEIAHLVDRPVQIIEETLRRPRNDGADAA